VLPPLEREQWLKHHPEAGLSYRGTLLIRNRTPLGPYRRPILGPRVVLGGWAFSYERGTPVTARGGLVLDVDCAAPGAVPRRARI